MKQNTWILLFLALLIWVGIVPPSFAASPDAKVLHVINRLSFGPRAGDIEAVKSIGIDAYIQSQLTPDSIAQPQALIQQLASLEVLQTSPAEMMKQYQQNNINKKAQRAAIAANQQNPLEMFMAANQPTTPANAIAINQQNAQAMQRRKVRDQAIQGRLSRAVASNRQLEEVMVDFWYNHFNVFSNKGLDRVLFASYEEQAIRPHIFGKFRSLLGATAKHPAMLFYLDNWQNTAPNSPGARGRYKGLNENYARELMELHTLGVNGGYSQQDVITLAHILTGWGIPASRQAITDPSGFYFDALRHDSSDKVFLGQPIKGGGMEEGEKALDMLARHPETARHISYKLAQYFVVDQPPTSLVDQLAKRFQETDGDLKAVLNTLFHSSEFLDAKYYNAKLKTPYQYVVSALRATDTKMDNYRTVAGVLNQMGMPLYGCLTPDGYKNTEEAWLNPDAILRRISLTTALVSGRFSGNSPVTAQQLEATLGNSLSSKTMQVILANPEAIKPALMLGSPEFMRR